MRPPRSLARPGSIAARYDAFSYEILAETASALGRIGRQLEEALEALRRHDATPGSNRDRDELVQDAAEKAWVLFIQRDHLGMKTDHHLLSTYKIPREVMLRVGVFGKKRG
ncbi:DUF6665 family protein [Oricola sp.]|uniref:DUF6665 family protein n=1 Tax=Oricola sp. TaxID=1979950 RepID=UPI003BABC607